MTKVMVDINREQSRTGRRARLDETQINRMVERYNNGETQKELAKAYGVSVSTIQRYIRQRKPQD